MPHELLKIAELDSFPFEVWQDPEIHVVHRQPRRASHLIEELLDEVAPFTPVHRGMPPLVPLTLQSEPIAFEVHRRTVVVEPELTTEERWPRLVDEVDHLAHCCARLARKADDERGEGQDVAPLELCHSPAVLLDGGRLVHVAQDEIAA